MDNLNENIKDLSEKEDKYIFWMDNPKILYINNGYLQFVPNSEMTKIEQLNAITRFCIYLILLFLLFGKSSGWLYLPITIILFVVILYNIYDYDPHGREKEYNKTMLNRKEEMTNSKIIPSHDMIETGRYDMDNNLIIGGKFNPPKYIRNPEESLYTPEELESYRKGTCRRPTKDNPFMNPPITDFGNGDVPSACNDEDDNIKEEVEKKFNVDLYRDVDDLFDIKNSQRQFYTVPNTSIPSDQPSFANWLYNSPTICKENQENCLRYNDLRYNDRALPI